MPSVATPVLFADRDLDLEHSWLPLPEELRESGLARCLEVIRPLIERSRNDLRRRIRDLECSSLYLPFDPDTVERLAAMNLALPLLRMISRVLVLELNIERLRGSLKGATPKERFHSFFDRVCQPERAAQLLADYPELASQVRLRLRQWVDFNLEFLRNIALDWPLLRRGFFARDPGLITVIESGAGDCHKEGRSVLRIWFSEGARLVYKPRSLAIDEHFQELLGVLNELGFQPRFRLLRCADRGEYGWSEFVSAEACKSSEGIARFYRRQGGNLALLYALEACDFHCENLIAAGEDPVLVDLEALFHPRLLHFPDDDADARAHCTLAHSVLRTGLLPTPHGDGLIAPLPDISGLGNPAGQFTPWDLPQWEAAETDEMRLGRKPLAMPTSENRPVWNGVEANAADHIGALETGFSDAYRLMLGNRERFLSSVRRFQRDETRVIVRRTQSYSRFLQESFHPDLLREREAHRSFFDQLAAASLPPLKTKRLLAAERRDLMQGDVPFFTTRPYSRDVWDSRGKPIRNFLPQEPIEAAYERLGDLSEFDLERQRWILRASLSAEPARTVSQRLSGATKRAEVSRATWLRAACETGDYLEKISIRGGNEISWLGLLDGGEGKSQPGSLGFDFYDGLSGIAVFLAELAAVSREERYEALARAAWNTVSRQIQQGDFLPVGGFNGWGGVIYAAVQLHVLWKEPRLWEQVESIVAKLPERIEKDTQLDLVGGVAGCALALGELLSRHPSPGAAEALQLCGERLLKSTRAMRTGIGWFNEQVNATALTGFAHGNAGIAYTLLRLFKHTSDNRFAAAAHAAIEYERSLFSEEEGNWPDLRKQTQHQFMVAWCHGAAGIALARLFSLDQMDDSKVRDEIKTGLRTTLRLGFGGNHSLCHGDFGNLCILLEAADRLGEPEWRMEAERIAARVLQEKAGGNWVCGNPAGIESPGLMTGLAGIGYGLLRLAEPALPCVLALA